MSENSFGKLSQQITELRTHLSERIDGLRSAIGELRDELAVTLRAGERIERAGAEIARGAAAEREERTRTLTERVAEIELHMQQLDTRVAVLEHKS
jgi:hypothetical protein